MPARNFRNRTASRPVDVAHSFTIKQFRLPPLLLGLVLGLIACAPHRPAPVEDRGSSLEPSAARAKPSTSKTDYSTTGRALVKRPKQYWVRKRDTLYAIAWRYGLDYRHLAAWNRVPPPYRIYPGQKLMLMPPPKTVPRQTQTAKPQAAPKSKPKTKSKTKTKPNSNSKFVQATPKPSVKPAAQKVARAKPKPVSTPKPDVKSRSKQPLKWQWPARGKLVQTFRKGDRTRQGIRIAGRPGQAIVAAEGGQVVYSGSGLPGYGKLIIIKHNKNYLSAYGFNRKLLVRDGDKVARGERVAEMGRSADGKPLLHFEIRRSDRVLNPLRLLPRL